MVYPTEWIEDKRYPIRYINENIVEIELPNKIIIKIDAKFMEKIIILTLNIIDINNKVYVVFNFDGSDYLLANLLINSDLLTEFINSDSLDLRQCNLKLTSHKNNICNNFLDNITKNKTWNNGCKNPMAKFINGIYYYVKFKETAEQKGGNVISIPLEYKDSNTKLIIECQEKHIFNLIPRQIKQNWCSHCNIHVGELISKCAIEFLLNDTFNKIKPVWLKSDNNTLLELDSYNDKLKIAIEYNGIQHYKNIKHFYKTDNDFIKRQEYDKIKVDKCKENDVLLIIVPYTIENKNICQFIADELIKNNHKISKELICTFDITEIYKSSSKTKKLNNFIELKGGKLINGSYINRESIIEIECANGHKWKTKIRNILDKKYWCPNHQCSMPLTPAMSINISNGIKEFNKSEKGKQINLIRMQNIIETKKKNRDELRLVIKEKICGYCKKKKSKENFAILNRAKDGLQVYCKVCTNEIRRKIRKNKITYTHFN